MKIIKFRVWDNNKKEMKYVPLSLVSDFVGWELMQFTGLLDKNGKDVYEGDIVKSNRNQKIARVVWRQTEPAKGEYPGMFGEMVDLEGFISEIGSFTFEGIGEKTTAYYVGQFEVVGNVFENSDLIDLLEKND